MLNKITFVAIILVLVFIFPLASSAFTLVVATDIHADGKKKIKNKETGNVIYPKKYTHCLYDIKKSKPDLVIVTGDLVNRGQKKYYRKLRRMMLGAQTLWAKGNHDSKNFRYLAADNYYIDYENWRFIVLDTSEGLGSSTGYLADSQISSLKEWLATDKNVAIAMHHAPFFYNSRGGIYTSEKAEPYDAFFAALTPNVKYVFTGHWHHDQQVEINGTTFLTQKALTQDNRCNYTIFDL